MNPLSCRSRGEGPLLSAVLSHEGQEAGAEGGGAASPLPRFATSLGLDLIIALDGRVVLIELQHHFGRRGLMDLFPPASRRYRLLSRRLRQEFGRCDAMNNGLRKVCTSKISTYRMFRHSQPSSLVYQGWSPAVARWLEGLSSDHVLIKPSRGSCGRGIEVFERRSFSPSALTRPLTASVLLQEYIESKPHPGKNGRFHVGCIRHILLLCSDGSRLGFIHLPPYWRVSPAPFSPRPEKRAFIANISAGAFAVPVVEGDARPVRSAAEEVAITLVRGILDLPSVPRGASSVISPERTLTPAEGPPLPKTAGEG